MQMEKTICLFFYSKNRVPFGPNYTGYFNDEFDKLFEQSYFENNAKKRYELYYKMDNMIMEHSSVSAHTV
jgi:oligopeptide transport system substrate-binding protein